MNVNNTKCERRTFPLVIIIYQSKLSSILNTKKKMKKMSQIIIQNIYVTGTCIIERAGQKQIE